MRNRKSVPLIRLGTSSPAGCKCLTFISPSLLKTLLEHDGPASIRRSAHALLARDESQIEYYEEITEALADTCLVSTWIDKAQRSNVSACSRPQSLDRRSEGSLNHALR